MHLGHTIRVALPAARRIMPRAADVKLAEDVDAAALLDGAGAPLLDTVQLVVVLGRARVGAQPPQRRAHGAH